MYQPAISILQTPTASGESCVPQERTFFDALTALPIDLWAGVQRRWRRERRRRKVGRAYDMALEIARVIPAPSRVLDVGCGNGFIAHHLSSLVGIKVIGIDLDAATEASIDYRQFDSRHFPVTDGAVDTVLLCYVLHHTQDLGAIMNEVRRVLSDGGLAVVYEDIPDAWWDRVVCWTHDLKWRRRTGPCTFRSTMEWGIEFNSAGFEIIDERKLARWRNVFHPVCRRLFLLRAMTGVVQA